MEIGRIEPGPREIGAAQIGAAKIGPRKIGPAKFRIGKLGLLQRGARKRNPREVQAGKICPPQFVFRKSIAPRPLPIECGAVDDFFGRKCSRDFGVEVSFECGHFSWQCQHIGDPLREERRRFLRRFYLLGRGPRIVLQRLEQSGELLVTALFGGSHGSLKLLRRGGHMPGGLELGHLRPIHGLLGEFLHLGNFFLDLFDFRF